MNNKPMLSTCCVDIDRLINILRVTGPTGPTHTTISESNM